MFSLYDVSVPVFIRALRNMDKFLQKGADWFAEQGRPESELTGARLIDDMHPLTAQIQRASDSAKGVVARLTGAEVPAMPDDEQTIADLRARIAKTIVVLESARREDFEGTEDKPVEIWTPKAALLFNGRSYVMEFAIPNVFFHVTAAYALLRKEGVPIGKVDYIGDIERRPH